MLLNVVYRKILMYNDNSTTYQLNEFTMRFIFKNASMSLKL